MFPRWLRILFRILIIVLAFLLLLWVAVAWYIHSHKKQLLAQITETISEEVNGTVIIRDIKPVLWKSFPNISVALSEVALRDSLWDDHGRSMVELNALYVRLNPFNLIRKKIDIRKITAADGYFCMFTDSSGYSNKYLFGQKKEKKKKKGPDLSFRKFSLDNVTLIMRDYIKNKDFRIHFKDLEGTAEQKNNIWEAALKLSADVQSFTFNTDKGSFLKGTTLKSNLDVRFDPDRKSLIIENQQIRIDDSRIGISASFSFAQTPAAFIIKIHSDKTHFQTAATWLSPSIYSKLDSIFFKNPMDLSADIRGYMKFRDTPTVLVHWATENNDLETPFADFTNSSFRGYFLNEAEPGKGHNDANTVIVLHKATAHWGGIPFMTDSVRLHNLSYPLLEFSFATAFPLKQMNETPVTLPFHFANGDADVQIYYRGGVRTDDTLHPRLKGHIKIRDAGFTYLPRQLSVSGTNATLLMEEDNLMFENISFRTRNSSVQMNGGAQDFFRFYFADPGKVTINWQATSDAIDLGDFVTLITKRQQNVRPAAKTVQRNKGAARIVNQLDKVLDASNIVLNIKLNKVRYHNFLATNIRAHTSLSQSEIMLSGVRLQHAGGTISLAGRINQEAVNNPFDITAEIQDVAVNKLFYAFDNFGQQTVHDKNLKGRFSAKARLSGNITDNGKLMQRSTKGFVDFSLRNGELINFDPLLKVSKFAFRKRNLSHVVFKDINNRLDINGDKIIIHPMTISSSALYIDIQGVYAITRGTDIAMVIPLRNPAKDGFDVNEDVIPKSERKKKGLTLYLRARDDGDGNVKLSWDPQKKGMAATDSLLNKP